MGFAWGAIGICWGEEDGDGVREAVGFLCSARGAMRWIVGHCPQSAGHLSADCGLMTYDRVLLAEFKGIDECALLVAGVVLAHCGSKYRRVDSQFLQRLQDLVGRLNL